MNFVGHITVALALDPDETAVALGAALPDLAAIGRFRLSDAATNPRVRAGVALHHRTDDAFHQHPSFRTWNAVITRELNEAGLNRGAARACGHVGAELLLDGRLLVDRPGLRDRVQTVLAAAIEPSSGIDRVVDQPRVDDWRRHRQRVATWPLPDDYHRPDAVAARIQRIVSHRPRLAFEADQVELVTRVLARHQPAIDAGADALVDDVARQVAID